jgi:hypothetical protein
LRRKRKIDEETLHAAVEDADVVGVFAEKDGVDSLSIRRLSIPARPSSWRLPGRQRTLCCVAYDAAGLSKHILVKLSMLTPRPG